jgi:tetratricopeptide (TPR) repeat protein
MTGTRPASAPTQARCDDPAALSDRDAAAHLQQLKAANPQAPAYLNVGRDWVRLARTRAEPGYYQQARACAEQALQLTPDEPVALQLVGLTLLNDHRFAEARELALKLLARQPDDALSWGTLSDAELELGHVDRAINAAQEMMDRKPNLPSYGRSAHLQWLQGEPTKAKLTYQQAIAAGREHKDREPSAWMITQAAWVFWHEGDYVGAAAGFQLALSEVSDYAPALEGLGRAALARGDQPAAIAALHKALASHPLVETAWALGDAHSLAGEHAAAEAAWARAVELGERHDPRTLALFYATKRREPREALRLARIAYQERQDCYSKDALAFALYRNGEGHEALPLARAAIALGIPDARLLYHAGLIERSAGDASRGDELLKRALALNPHFDILLTGGPDGSLASKL